ncbi:MAG TPA: response regulator [Acidimicrobiales bacterium]|nr:response regulator [Acidimicrobiales bacterium]
MPEILVVSDSPKVREEVVAAIPDPAITVRELTEGRDVRPAVNESTPDLVVVDQQIGRMGAMAVCLDLHLEHGAGRLPHIPVLMLLDRRADVFLARRSDAEGWVVKPLDPLRLGRAISTLLAGGTYEDAAYRPPTVALR